MVAIGACCKCIISWICIDDVYLVICDEAQGYKFDGFVNLYPSVCSIVSEPVVHSHASHKLFVSLVPRPRGRRKDGLVSTARASAAISDIFP